MKQAGNYFFSLVSCNSRHKTSDIRRKGQPVYLKPKTLESRWVSAIPKKQGSTGLAWPPQEAKCQAGPADFVQAGQAGFAQAAFGTDP